MVDKQFQTMNQTHKPRELEKNCCFGGWLHITKSKMIAASHFGWLRRVSFNEPERFFKCRYRTDINSFPLSSMTNLFIARHGTSTVSTASFSISG